MASPEKGSSRFVLSGLFVLAILSVVPVAVFLVRQGTASAYVALAVLVVLLSAALFAPGQLRASKHAHGDVTTVARGSEKLELPLDMELLETAAPLAARFLWSAKHLTAEQWDVVRTRRSLVRYSLVSRLIALHREERALAELEAAQATDPRVAIFSQISRILETWDTNGLVRATQSDFALVRDTGITLCYADILSRKAIQVLYRPFADVIPLSSLS